MRRLRTRLVISHALVALFGAVATYLVVRSVAPAMFNRTLRGTPGARGRCPGGGAGPVLRDQFAHAVDQALWVGAGVGLLAATVLGVAMAYRLARPIAALGSATRELAAGRYATVVPRPGITELAELSDGVVTLRDELASTEARRVRLLGEVAHEMRTPLTVIDGYVEAMIDGVVPASGAELGRLGEETRRLRRLSDDLSALSRTEEGRLELTSAPLDLAAVARATAERLRPQLADAGLRLELDLDGPLPVTGDEGRLGQIVTNLIGNALRATPPGGTVSVTARQGGRRAEVTVADTGEGLAQADLERIFERFYRVPGRRAATQEAGSGIGLTIARGIARAHDGELTVASEGPGRGAAFTLSLPSRDR